MLAEKVSRWIYEYIAEGRAEGIIEGRVQGILTIFRRMKDSGMSIQEMARITGLSEDEIIETRYLEGDPNLELIRRDFSFFFQIHFLEKLHHLIRSRDGSPGIKA